MMTVRTKCTAYAFPFIPHIILWSITLPHVADMYVYTPAVVRVEFEFTLYNVSESSPYVEVSVVKQGSSDVNVTVLLSAVDGTAIGKYILGDIRTVHGSLGVSFPAREKRRRKGTHQCTIFNVCVLLQLQVTTYKQMKQNSPLGPLLTT